MKHLLLAPSSAALASPTFSYRRPVWSPLLLAAILPILWLGVLAAFQYSGLRGWGFGFSLSLLLVNCQKAEDENANSIVPSSSPKSDNYLNRVFHTRQELECLTVLLKDEGVLSLLLYWEVNTNFHMAINNWANYFYFKNSCILVITQGRKLSDAEM